MNLQEHLVSLDACEPAREWVGNKTPRQAWEECENPQWMLWWAERTLANDKKQFVKIACEIERSVLHLVPPEELRPLRAIEAAERWVEEPTEENAKAADLASREAWMAVWTSRIPASIAKYAADSASGLEHFAIGAWFAVRTVLLKSGEQKIKEICDIIRANLHLPWEETI